MRKVGGKEVLCFVGGLTTIHVMEVRVFDDYSCNRTIILYLGSLTERSKIHVRSNPCQEWRRAAQEGQEWFDTTNGRRLIPGCTRRRDGSVGDLPIE